LVYFRDAGPPPRPAWMAISTSNARSYNVQTMFEDFKKF